MSLLLATSVSFADDEMGWDSLSTSQQEVLSRFSEDWDSLPADHRKRLVSGAKRWSGMTPEQRDAAQNRFGDW